MNITIDLVNSKVVTSYPLVNGLPSNTAVVKTLIYCTCDVHGRQLIVLDGGSPTLADIQAAITQRMNDLMASDANNTALAAILAANPTMTM
jgi:hypothetical protein